MMGAFEEEFHGNRFPIPDSSYDLSLGGQSWGVNPTYSQEWDGIGDSEIRLQISRRETPTVTPERQSQCERRYFKLLPFPPIEITFLALWHRQPSITKTVQLHADQQS
jgi:hypothetical protein